MSLYSFFLFFSCDGRVYSVVGVGDILMNTHMHVNTEGNIEVNENYMINQ